MISYIHIFLFALSLTLLVEVPILFVVVRYFFRDRKLKIPKIIFTGIFATGLTFPYFWFVLPFYIHSRFWYIFFGEVAIFFIEAVIYRQFLGLKFTRAMIVSAAANIASLVVGLLIL